MRQSRFLGFTLMAGIHFMSDNLEGQKAGIKVADWVFDSALQPLP